MSTLPTGQGIYWDIARALHNGHTWGDIAISLGSGERTVRAFYRPRIAKISLRLVERDPHTIHIQGVLHGTVARYRAGACLPDGRRCEPCTAAQSAYSERARRDRIPLPTDERFLRSIAQRLHDGHTWQNIADDLGRTPAGLHHQLRDAVQPFALALITAAAPPEPGEPAHGTRWRYVDRRWRCKCEPCTYSGVTYERRRTALKRRGLEPYADATKARAHVEWLRSQGIGWKRVAHLAGLSTSTVWKLIYGDASRDLAPSKRIRASTGRKLMAVQPTTPGALADGARIDAAPTRAAIAVLVDNGWTKRAIAERLGVQQSNLMSFRNTVTVRKARAVAELLRTEPIPPPDARPKQEGGVGGLAQVRERERLRQEAERRAQYRHQEREAS